MKQTGTLILFLLSFGLFGQNYVDITKDIDFIVSPINQNYILDINDDNQPITLYFEERPIRG